MSTHDGGLAVCTVSSYNYLHFTLSLVRSIRARWGAKPIIYVVLIDQEWLPRPGFDTTDNVTFVSAAELGIANLTWIHLKHDASQTCMVVRPFALEYLMQHGHDEVFYCDSDVHFFGDIAPFLGERKSADFVVTPHMLSPLPRDTLSTKMHFGYVTAAGIVNNGMFLCRNTPSARQFLRQYCDFMASPAAWHEDLGAVKDQHFFNWIAAFGADVELSRNTGMNVAYWNLHERPVRWARLDDGPADKWSVDGKDLISFHFSGFDWNRGALSFYDDRPTTTWNASLYALCEYYRADLRSCMEEYYSGFGYQFDTLGGISLTREIRLEFKRSARVREPRLATWESSSPDAFRHLNSVLGAQYLLPLYFENIMFARSDLRSVSGDERVHSPFLMWWANEAFAREYAVGAIWERYVDFAFHKEFLAELAKAIAPHLKSSTLDTAVSRLKSDRRALIDELASTSVSKTVLERIKSADYRYAAFLVSQCLRLIYESWATLRTAFPDPLGRDQAAFRAWLSSDLTNNFEVPQTVSAFVETFDLQASLARVIGFARRNPHTASTFRTHGVSKQLFASMNGLVNAGLGYTADDLILVDWWLERRSQSEIDALSVYAPDDIGTPSGDLYLEAWLDWRKDRLPQPVDPAVSMRREDIASYVVATAAADNDRSHRPGRASRSKKSEIFVDNAAVAASAVASRRFPGERQPPADLVPDASGINLFGYFKSPSGIGVASKGVAKALNTAEFAVRENLLLYYAGDAGYSLPDLALEFAFNYPRTMFVTYPHIGYRMSEILPEMFTRGRETIGYFAWEQRDFPQQWRPIVDQYDTVCALSKFASEAISRGIGRPVHTLPCVVEIGQAIAKADARKMHGIPNDKFVVGFAFDAGSSIDRKNPVAFVDAVIGAFSGRSEVLVIVKYANALRDDISERFYTFRDRLARSGLDYRIITDHIDRAQVEALIAAMDVYVSLHRSEGFGYTLAEAMMLGVPAMATGYSGNLDFMTEANSYLVDYKESVVRRRDGPFEIGSVWAEPDIDDAVDKLKSIYADYGRAQEKAQRAKRDVENTVSVAAVAKRLKEILG